MAREGDCYSVGVTLLNVGTGASTFVALLPQKNQVGVAFFLKSGSATLEIAGGGYSLATTGTSFVLLNQATNQGQPVLVANGSGYPVYANTALNPQYFAGQPVIWLSAGGATGVVAVMYYKNSQEGA